jgi:hypothetical protein
MDRFQREALPAGELHHQLALAADSDRGLLKSGKVIATPDSLVKVFDADWRPSSRCILLLPSIHSTPRAHYEHDGKRGDRVNSRVHESGADSRNSGRSARTISG